MWVSGTHCMRRSARPRGVTAGSAVPGCHTATGQGLLTETVNGPPVVWPVTVAMTPWPAT
jgi:hypothetical protein